MTKLKLAFLLFYIITISSILGFGCPFGGGSTQPAVTITAVDCPADSVQITASSTKRNNGGDWITTVTVSVKCNGRPIANAEVRVDFWFPGGNLKWTTDANGMIQKNPGPKQGDPTGERIDITVKGSDGDKSVNITVP